jgi:hypothetical protein
MFENFQGFFNVYRNVYYGNLFRDFLIPVRNVYLTYLKSPAASGRQKMAGYIKDT